MADIPMNKYRQDLKKTNVIIIVFTIMLVIAIIILLNLILK